MSTIATTQVPTGTWAVDPAHSNVEFQVKHMGIATVRGAFRQFEGTLEVGETTRGYGTVEVTAIDSNVRQCDAHLRSPDFFDAAQLQQISFESTAIRAIDDETFEITGELSLHGVTREITLTAEVTGTDSDPWGNERVGLEVTGQLSRGDFGMRFNQALGSGNALVSDKVKIRLDISAVKQA